MMGAALSMLIFFSAAAFGDTWVNLPKGSITANSCSSGQFADGIAFDGTLSCATPSGGGGITALTGDVTASGSGSVAATVAKIQGVAVLGTTGTQNVVFSNSPTLVTPALGTPSALVGTNISGTGSSFTAGNVNATSNSTLTTLSGLTTASGLASIGTVTSGTWNATTIALAHGGSGQTSAQAAMNAFAGSVTSGDFLRGNGSNVVMSTIQSGDIPNNSANTGGSAGSLSQALSSGEPVIGSGIGITIGSKSGNTTEFATVNGSTITGDCVQWDDNGNASDSGAPCGGGSGSPGGSDGSIQYNNSGSFGGFGSYDGSFFTPGVNINMTNGGSPYNIYGVNQIGMSDGSSWDPQGGGLVLNDGGIQFNQGGQGQIYGGYSISFQNGGMVSSDDSNGIYLNGNVVDVTNNGNILLQQPYTFFQGFSFNSNAYSLNESGSISGSAYFVEPETGTSDHRVLIYFSALNGTATYSYYNAFTYTPGVFASSTVAATAVTSVSTTSVTVTGTSTTGFLFLEGF